VELRQLRYFEAVARHASFTRAAEELHVVQSALSQQVRRLEQELGVELMERTSRSVRLTSAGEAVLLRARRVLEEADALRAEVDGLRSLDGGRVALGTIPAMGAVDPPALVARFREQHPGVSFELRTGTASHVYGLLASGGLEAAFVAAGPDELPPGLAGEALGAEPLVVIVPPEHPLARRDVLRLADLDGQPLVELSQRSALGMAATAALQQAGVEPTVVANVTDEPSMARALVARGLGVAIVPRALAVGEGPPIVLVPLDPPLVRPVGLAWSAARRPTAALAAFIDFVRGAFAAA
jgi:LysR family transcriptional regulator, transcription activator of glutamate synthase operon